jgi:beta-glucosidase
MDFHDRVAAMLAQLTVAEKILLLHQYQAAVPRLGIGAFRTGTEALHGLAWLGEATVFPQAIGLGASWDPELVQRVGAAVATEVRARHHKDPAEAGLNVWAPVVNPLRDPRWGRNEEGYSEDAWLTGLIGQAYAQGLRGDHPRYLRTAPTLKHFLGYNNETDRCTSSSHLPPRVLHEYEFPAYRPAIESGAAVAVMAAYNLVNGRPAHVTPHLADLRGWIGEEIFAVSDAYAPSNLADLAQQAYFTRPGPAGSDEVQADHAAAHAAALRAGIDSFTDCGDQAEITAGRITEAFERGLLTEADLDRAVRRALLLRMRLGEFDPPEQNPYSTAEADYAAHAALAREAARRSVVLLKREGGVLPLQETSAGRVAVLGPLADQVMTDWYSGTMPYQVTVREGLESRLGAARVLCAEGADRIALRRADGAGYLCALGGAVTGTLNDAYGFDVFDWGGEDVVALRAVSDGRYLTAREGKLGHDSPGPHGWEVHETFQFAETEDGSFLLRHVLSGLPVGFADDGSAVLDADRPASFEIERRIDGAAQAALLAAQAEVAIVVLGNHPLVNGRETEDRQTLSLPRAQERLLRKVFAANPATVLVLTSSYPYGLGWAAKALPAIIWSSHGGQEHGHALAEILTGEADPAGRLPQTWYADHTVLPDLFDYDIIRADATYLYHRGEPLYPFGHGLSWADFSYREVRLSHESATAADRVTVSAEVANTGDRPGEELVQVYTRQLTSRAKQPLRQLRAFARVALRPGEQRTVSLSFEVASLAFWDVASGRPVVEPARHQVMVGRSATSVKLTACLEVRGEPLPDRPHTWQAKDFDDYSEASIVPLRRSDVDAPDAVVGLAEGSWLRFGAADLTGCASVSMTVAGEPGRVSLRAGDPFGGPVLAELAFDEPGKVTAPLREPAGSVVYLVWHTAGVIVSQLDFA